MRQSAHEKAIRAEIEELRAKEAQIRTRISEHESLLESTNDQIYTLERVLERAKPEPNGGEPEGGDQAQASAS